jgi:hypothetical protein
MWTVRAYAFLLALLLIQFGYSTIGAAEAKKSVPLKKPVANPTPVPQVAEKEAQPTAVADEESEEDSEEEAEEESEEESESTWALGATGQLLGTIIPTKFGAYADRVWDEELTSELAVVRGSISVPAWVGDIGSISETSVLLVNRSRIGEGKTSSRTNPVTLTLTGHSSAHSTGAVSKELVPQIHYSRRPIFPSSVEK